MGQEVEESDSITIEELLLQEQIQEEKTEVELDESEEVDVYEEDISDEILEDYLPPPPPPPPREIKDLGVVDTLSYGSTSISDSTITAYKENPDFKYNRKNSSGFSQPNWLRKFLNLIFGGLEKLLGFPLPPWLFGVLRWVFILGLGLFLVYVIAKFSGLEIKFKRKKKEVVEEISFETIEENLEEVDFDLLLEKAIKEKSYRVAVRLFFLKNLQNLTKREFIQWAIDKTNNDYKYELAETSLRPDFEKTIYLFEHIWYGQFELSESDFQRALNTFRNFQNKIADEK